MTTETSAPTPDPYPEHTKQSLVLIEAHAIGEFLESSGYILAKYEEIEGYREPVLMPVSTPIQQILAKYFRIDLGKIDAERRVMLAKAAAILGDTDTRE